MALETRENERFFAKIEAAFGDTSYSSFIAADAILLNELAFTPKKNRTISQQRAGTPDELRSIAARGTVGYTASGLWAPSGAVATPSDYSVLITGLMGSIHTAALTTTIASGPLATGATLTSVTGLAVGDVVVVTMTDGTREPTRIKTLVGSAVTWDPLTAAPPAAAVVVSGSTYTLTTAKPGSLTFGKHETIQDVKEAISGAVADSITLTLTDGGQPTFQLTGTAKQYFSSGITFPASITTAEVDVTGLVGGFYSDGNAFIANQVAITMGNQIQMVNRGIGQATPRDYQRTAKRQARVTVDFHRSDYRLRDLAAANTTAVLRVILGQTTGAMLGAILPKVEYELPDYGDDGGFRSGSIAGVAYAPSSNDSLALFES